MIILQCRECDSLNLKTIEGNFDLKCMDCGNKDYINYVNLYETTGDTVVSLDNPYWISKEGIKYEFKNMSSEHIKNAINMLKRSYTREQLTSSILFKGLSEEYFIR